MTDANNDVPIRHVVGLSGGKDSTALALRLVEVYPEREFDYIFNETGDELPEMREHLAHLETLLGKSILRVGLTRAGVPVTLNDLIAEQNCIPNAHIRWCTRMLKIQPTIAFVKRLRVEGFLVHLYVGLRADEETREGIYGPDVHSVFPFREWGWGVSEVWAYLRQRGVKIPRRTDCARCYAQRLGEWYQLWRLHPDIYASAVEQERTIGHTFRRPERDSFPTSLTDLAATFAAGRVPRSEQGGDQLSLFGVEGNEDTCRVCRL